MFPVFVVFLVLVAIAIFRSRNSQPPAPKTTDEAISFLVSEAVDIANKSYHLKLDFSPASIEQVENVILKPLHDEYVRTKSDTGLRGLAMCFGAYVGECIRKNELGAKWESDHDVMGEKTYPIQWSGGTSFPMEWCYKRIFNGPEDNVWHKYLVLKAQSLEAEKK